MYINMGQHKKGGDGGGLSHAALRQTHQRFQMLMRAAEVLKRASQLLHLIMSVLIRTLQPRYFSPVRCRLLLQAFHVRAGSQAVLQLDILRGRICQLLIICRGCGGHKRLLVFEKNRPH